MKTTVSNQAGFQKSKLFYLYRSLSCPSELLPPRAFTRRPFHQMQLNPSTTKFQAPKIVAKMECRQENFVYSFAGEKILSKRYRPA